MQQEAHITYPTKNKADQSRVKCERNSTNEEQIIDGEARYGEIAQLNTVVRDAEGVTRGETWPWSWHPPTSFTQSIVILRNRSGLKRTCFGWTMTDEMAFFAESSSLHVLGRLNQYPEASRRREIAYQPPEHPTRIPRGEPHGFRKTNEA